MKKLNFNQMAMLNGGQTLSLAGNSAVMTGAVDTHLMTNVDGLSKAGNNVSCAFAIVGAVTALIGLTALTAGTATIVVAATVAGAIVGPSGAALSCAHLANS